MLGHRECQCDDFYRQIVLDYEKSDFYHFKQKNYVVNFYRFKFNLPNFYRTPTLCRVVGMPGVRKKKFSSCRSE